MPNHVTNVVTASNEVLKALMDDKGNATFTKLVPEPENIETDGCSMDAVNGVHAGGVVCWYDWHLSNWGTKWDAYDSIYTGDKLQFDTAWSTPAEVWKALHAKFPDEHIEIEWADEDFGYNVGTITIDPSLEDGFLINKLDNSDAGNELAAKIKYGKSYAEVLKEWGDEEEVDWANVEPAEEEVVSEETIEQG